MKSKKVISLLTTSIFVLTVLSTSFFASANLEVESNTEVQNNNFRETNSLENSSTGSEYNYNSKAGFTSASKSDFDIEFIESTYNYLSFSVILNDPSDNIDSQLYGIEILNQDGSKITEYDLSYSIGEINTDITEIEKVSTDKWIISTYVLPSYGDFNISWSYTVNNSGATSTYDTTKIDVDGHGNNIVTVDESMFIDNKITTVPEFSGFGYNKFSFQKDSYNSATNQFYFDYNGYENLDDTDSFIFKAYLYNSNENEDNAIVIDADSMTITGNELVLDFPDNANISNDSYNLSIEYVNDWNYLASEDYYGDESKGDFEYSIQRFTNVVPKYQEASSSNFAIENIQTSFNALYFEITYDSNFTSTISSIDVLPHTDDPDKTNVDPLEVLGPDGEPIINSSNGKPIDWSWERNDDQYGSTVKLSNDSSSMEIENIVAGEDNIGRIKVYGEGLPGVDSYDVRIKYTTTRDNSSTEILSFDQPTNLENNFFIPSSDLTSDELNGKFGPYQYETASRGNKNDDSDNPFITFTIIDSNEINDTEIINATLINSYNSSERYSPISISQNGTIVNIDFGPNAKMSDGPYRLELRYSTDFNYSTQRYEASDATINIDGPFQSLDVSKFEIKQTATSYNSFSFEIIYDKYTNSNIKKIEIAKNDGSSINGNDYVWEFNKINENNLNVVFDQNKPYIYVDVYNLPEQDQKYEIKVSYDDISSAPNAKPDDRIIRSLSFGTNNGSISGQFYDDIQPGTTHFKSLSNDPFVFDKVNTDLKTLSLKLDKPYSSDNPLGDSTIENIKLINSDSNIVFDELDDSNLVEQINRDSNKSQFAISDNILQIFFGKNIPKGSYDLEITYISNYDNNQNQYIYETQNLNNIFTITENIQPTTNNQGLGSIAYFLFILIGVIILLSAFGLGFILVKK